MHIKEQPVIWDASLVLFLILPRVIVVVKRNYVTQRWEFPTLMTYSLFRHTHWKAPQGKGRGIPGCLRFRYSDRKINQMIKKTTLRIQNGKNFLAEYNYKNTCQL